MLFKKKYHSEPLSNKVFLVTGGAGFIGSNIVEYLLKHEAKKVVILDNFSTGKRENIEPFLVNQRCVLITGDIRDKKTCEQAMEQVDYVLHQAALGSVPRSIEDPIETNSVNVSGFLNILITAKESKTVKKLVYAASSSTYGDSKILPKVEDVIGKPLSPYAITKYVNELYAENFSKIYNFHTVGLRYFNVFGPKQDPDGAYAAVIPLFMDGAINKKKIRINGDGKQTRDFTFIENVIQANIKAVLSNFDAHEVFNVAVGERISIIDLWKSIEKLVNANNEITYGETRLGDVKDSLANIDKVKKMLKYEAYYKLNDGLKVSLDWYKKRKNEII